MRHTFKVYERLKREQHIHTLFRTGKACSVFPVKILYSIFQQESKANMACSIQVGFSVPKKKFRKSVQRHRIRRLMFEAWRLSKHELANTIPTGYSMHVFLIFMSAEEETYATVEAAVQAGIKKLSEAARRTEK